jgi:hypothetical protein
MKVQSNLQPQEIYIDKVKNGRVRLLCRWDVSEVTHTDEIKGEVQTLYDYEEKVLWWTFPLESDGLVLNNIENIEQYIQNNKTEILNFAKGSKISL